jgi:hypothetical protein
LIKININYINIIMENSKEEEWEIADELKNLYRDLYIIKL